MKLLTLNNTAKTVKGIQYGYNTAILHLKPSAKTCPFASKACMASCLNYSGRGGMNMIQQARQRKTDWYLNDTAGFISQLYKELALLNKRVGQKWAIRLNGTSDLAFPVADMVEAFPNLKFYDYTKDYSKAVNSLYYNKPYHVTFSFSGENEKACLDILGRGGNVAVPFKGTLPKTWNGFKVIDGDEHDLRFLDGTSKVVGLVFKQPKDSKRVLRREIAMTSGFVV